MPPKLLTPSGSPRGSMGTVVCSTSSMLMAWKSTWTTLAREGRVLDFLDKRHAVGGRAGILDFEFDEDVFAERVGKHVADVARADLEREGALLCLHRLRRERALQF